MEMLPLGEFDPVYRSQLDVQHGELPVLPLSIYGAVAMAHPGADIPDGYAAGNEFFVYKVCLRRMTHPQHSSHSLLLETPTHLSCQPEYPIH